MFCLDGIFRVQQKERLHINDQMQYNTYLEKRRTKEAEKSTVDDKGEHSGGVCILIGLSRNRTREIHICVIQVPTRVYLKNLNALAQILIQYIVCVQSRINDFCKFLGI